MNIEDKFLKAFPIVGKERERNFVSRVISVLQEKSLEGKLDENYFLKEAKRVFDDRQRIYLID
jgi:hypothetical protein